MALIGRCRGRGTDQAMERRGPERTEHRQAFGVALLQAREATSRPRMPAQTACRFEGVMATRNDHRVVETPTEARQGELGPSVVALLAVALGLAVLVLAVVWFAFFRT